MNKVVIVDIDGVIAKTEPFLLDELKDYYEGVFDNRHIYSFEDRFRGNQDLINAVERTLNYPLFYRNVPPDLHAINFVADLKKSGFPIMYVTSRPRITNTFTGLWLQKYTYDYSHTMGVWFAEDKAHLLEDVDVEFVIDDSPKQIKSLKESGKVVFCWAQPWNEGVFPRLFSDRDGTVYLWEREDVEEEPFWKGR